MSVPGQAWPLPTYGANPQSSSNGFPFARVGQNLVLLLAIPGTLANCFRAWHIVGAALGLGNESRESGTRRGGRARLLDCVCVGGGPYKRGVERGVPRYPDMQLSFLSLKSEKKALFPGHFGPF